jgi:hypothetical protein
LQSEVRPTISRFSSTLMAHYRSRIGSLVGWGLPVTLGAPTPLLDTVQVQGARIGASPKPYGGALNSRSAERGVQPNRNTCPMRSFVDDLQHSGYCKQ